MRPWRRTRPWVRRWDWQLPWSQSIHAGPALSSMLPSGALCMPMLAVAASWDHVTLAFMQSTHAVVRLTKGMRRVRGFLPVQGGDSCLRAGVGQGGGVSTSLSEPPFFFLSFPHTSCPCAGQGGGGRRRCGGSDIAPGLISLSPPVSPIVSSFYRRRRQWMRGRWCLMTSWWASSRTTSRRRSAAPVSSSTASRARSRRCERPTAMSIDRVAPAPLPQ